LLSPAVDVPLDDGDDRVDREEEEEEEEEEAAGLLPLEEEEEEEDELLFTFLALGAPLASGFGAGRLELVGGATSAPNVLVPPSTSILAV
jgi:hypothetical protein